MAALTGTLAVAIAGVGAVNWSALAPNDQTVSHRPVANYVVSGETQPDPTADRGNSIEVSRSIDRTTLRKQAEQQAEQRTKALAELAGQTEDRTKELQKAEQRAQARAEAREESSSSDAPTPEGAVAASGGGQWVLPLAGYSLTATFGQSSGLWASTHTGLDFAAASGTPLVAVSGGTVTETSYAGAYGNRTILTLDDGTEIWYCHQTSFSVSAGESVQPGQTIGTVGATGNVTGPHLHLEVHPGGGAAVDPYSALSQHGATP